MPSVPRYNSNQVQESVGPQVRQSAEASPDAFGAGRAFDSMSDSISDFATRARDNADQLAVTEAQVNQARKRTALEFDPNNGFYNKRGKDAMTYFPKALEDFDNSAAEIEKNLTPRQAEMFRRTNSMERAQLESGFQRHLSGEIKRYDDETTTAFVKTEGEAAILNYQDPEKIQFSLDKIKGSLTLAAQRKGLPPEVLKMQVEMAESGVHSGIVERYLNNGDDRGAKAYFEQYKGALTGTDTAKLEKNLEVGSLRGESQRLSDQIFSESPTLGKALERAKGIEDPQLRDETVRRVRDNFAQKEAIENDQKEQRSVSVASLLEKENGNLDKIPPDQWNQMSASERAGWRNYSKSLKDGGSVQTDWKEYNKLHAMAADASTRSDFMSLNMYDYKSYLADTEFKEMVKAQSELRQKNGAGGAIEGVVTDAQIFNDALKTMGLNPKGSGDAEDIANFRGAWNRAVQAKQSSLKRKLSDEEKIALKDDLLVQVVTEKRSILPNKKKRAWELESEDSVEAIRIQDIPRQAREQIKASKSYKQDETEDNLMRIYSEVYLGRKLKPRATN